jgi:hypothetical protein
VMMECAILKDPHIDENAVKTKVIMKGQTIGFCKHSDELWDFMKQFSYSYMESAHISASQCLFTIITSNKQ